MSALQILHHIDLSELSLTAIIDAIAITTDEMITAYDDNRCKTFYELADYIEILESELQSRDMMAELQ